MMTRLTERLEQIGDKARKVLATKDAARERAIPLSRDAVRYSADAIRAIHRSEFDKGRELLDTASNILELDWEQYVEIDPRYFRPSEVDYLLGDATKAREKLGWKPSISFEELVKMMVECDLELAQQEKTLRNAGHVISKKGAVNG